MQRVKKILQRNKKLFQDYISVMAGVGFGRGLSLLTSIILARALGVEGFGLFSVFFTVATFFWLTPSTLDTVYVRFVKAEGQSEKKEYMRATLFLKIIIFLVLLAAAYPLSYFLAHYVFRKPELLYYLVTAILAGAFLTSLSSVAGIYLAQEKFKVYSLINVVFYALVFLVIGGLVIFKATLGPGRVAVVYTAASLLLGVFAVIYLYKIVRPVFSLRPALFFRMMHFGKWVLLESLILILLSRLDVLFLAKFSDYASLGVYSAAVRIAMFASLLSSSVSAVFMPRGCESFKSLDKLKNYFRESYVAILALSPLIFLLMLFSPMIIRVLFGSEYLGSLLPARILLLEAIFTLVYTPFSYIFFATDNSKLLFKVGIVRLSVAFICLLVLVPVFGPVGAAMAIAISSFCGLVLGIFLSRRIIRRIHIDFSITGCLAAALSQD